MSGDSVLLQPQLAHEEIVDHVLRTHQQLDWAIDGYRERRGLNDVIFAGRIARIEPERISRGRAISCGSSLPNFPSGPG